MAENNGTVIKMLVGFLWTVVFFSITALASNLIATDKDSRTRDSDLNEKISCQDRNIRAELNACLKEQNQKLEKLIVAVAEINTSLKYR